MKPAIALLALTVLASSAHAQQLTDPPLKKVRTIRIDANGQPCGWIDRGWLRPCPPVKGRSQPRHFQ
jgi:hypothetical protein